MERSEISGFIDGYELFVAKRIEKLFTIFQSDYPFSRYKRLKCTSLTHGAQALRAWHLNSAQAPPNLTFE